MNSGILEDRSRWRRNFLLGGVAVLFVVAGQFSFARTQAADPPGLLVVRPDNPRYVMVQDDPTRKAVCLTGAHTWAEFQTYRQETFDYNGWLRKLAGWKHNFMRGWIWEDGFYSPLPYATVGKKYDLTKYNSAYFDRLKTRIREAGHMIDVIKRYEATKPKQHLVWVNLSPPECFATNCPADIVSPSGSRVYFRAPPAADGTKVIVADSDHISPLRVTHEWASSNLRGAR